MLRRIESGRRPMRSASSPSGEAAKGKERVLEDDTAGGGRQERTAARASSMVAAAAAAARGRLRQGRVFGSGGLEVRSKKAGPGGWDEMRIGLTRSG